jgi:ribosomal protein S18 acetylase RimI-like enzyme
MHSAADTIRRAGPADAAAIDDLTQAAYAKWVPVIGRKPRPMTVDYAKAVVEHQIDLVDAEAGLIALIELDRQPDHLLIVNLAVHPDHQRQGLGRRLLEHAESVARAIGVPELRLYTNRLMAANIALYQSCGYAIDREEPFPDGGFTVHLSKPAPANPALAGSGPPR